MPKYTVYIRETVQYSIDDVEAGTPEEAELLAEEILVNADDMDKYFDAVDDRTSWAEEVTDE